MKKRVQQDTMPNGSRQCYLVFLLLALIFAACGPRPAVEQKGRIPGIPTPEELERRKKPQPARVPPIIVPHGDVPPATAAFPFQPGDTFSYILVDSAGREIIPNSGPLILGRYKNFPFSQRITFPRSQNDTLSAPLFTITKKVINKNYIADRGQTARFSRMLASAHIDRTTGLIIDEFRFDQDQHDVDTLTSEFWDFTGTLWYWYGPWMLHLSDDFSYAQDELSPVGGTRTRTLTVVGQETISGRQCYVVTRSIGAPGRQSTGLTYWVDKEKRIVVQVEAEGQRLILHGAQDSTKID